MAKKTETEKTTPDEKPKPLGLQPTGDALATENPTAESAEPLDRSNAYIDPVERIVAERDRARDPEVVNQERLAAASNTEHRTPAAAGAPAAPLKTFPSKREGERVREIDPEERVRLGTHYHVCPYHNCKCEPTGTHSFFTWFGCPVKGCSYSVKIPRPKLREHLDRQADQTNFSAR